MEYTDIDFRNIHTCAGACHSLTPMLDYDSKAKRNVLYTLLYPGHTTKLALKNAYLCLGCEKRYEEHWDILEWGLECNTQSEIQEARDWFEQEASTILAKFAKQTEGGVHYLTSEGDQE